MKKKITKKNLIIYKKYLSTKKRSIKLNNKKFNNQKPILNILLKNKNSKVLIEKLINTINLIKDKNNLTKILDTKKITYFNKDKIGKSGAKIGFININNCDYIIKTFKFKNPKVPFNKSNDNCLKLFTPYNEILQNILVSNITFFLNNKEYTIFKKHNFANNILKLEGFGLDNNRTFIINKLVGLTNNKHYFTNLGELFKNHYLELLSNAFKEEKYNIINLFFTFLTEKIDHYFKFLRLLNKKIGYINTDLKCANIFIKKSTLTTSNVNKYKLLLDNGFILNYTFLVSDLDKATTKINNVSFKANESKLLEKILSKTNTRLSNIYKFRYKCFNDPYYCKIFKSYDFDRITLFYDIYILLYTQIYKTHKFNSLDQFYGYLSSLNNYVMKSININNGEFKIFYNRIHNSFFIKTKPSNIKLSLHINALLYNFCKRLTKDRNK